MLVIALACVAPPTSPGPSSARDTAGSTADTATSGHTGDSGPGDSGPTDSGAAPAVAWRRLSTDGGAVCGIRVDGTLRCWGRDTYAQVSTAPTEGVFLDVSVGTDPCAVRDDGAILCWGLNLGHLQDAVPTGPFVSVAVGSGFACALAADGTPTCWGPADQTSGTLAPRLARMSVGAHLVCGLDPAGALACDGSFGDGLDDPTPLGGVYAEVVAPGTHGCVSDLDGAMSCFNDRWDDADYEVPGTGLHHLSTGLAHTCALDAAGEVGCAGASGVEETLAGMPPGPWVDLASGGHTLCGIRADGAAACWGDVAHGQDAVPTE